jgi:hypothetical protein
VSERDGDEPQPGGIGDFSGAAVFAKQASTFHNQLGRRAESYDG